MILPQDIIDKFNFTGEELAPEYMNKYSQLIIQNLDTDQQKGKTQRHHVVPQFCYVDRQLPVDNSPSNQVNLLYKDHILAHYYLAMAGKGIFAYKNFVPMFIILGHKDFSDTEEDFIRRLPDIQALYEKCREVAMNPMFNEGHKLHHDNIMRTPDVRNRISQTMRKVIQQNENMFNEEHRRKLAEQATGRIVLHDSNGNSKHVKDPQKIEQLLNEGWVVGGPPVPKYIVEKRSITRYRPVHCEDLNGNVKAFPSVKSAAQWWYENGYGDYDRKLPKHSYELMNIIKQSSKEDKYTCGLKWFYDEKVRK